MDGTSIFKVLGASLAAVLGPAMAGVLTCPPAIASPGVEAPAMSEIPKPGIENPSPDFLDLWDFRDPAATEARFREELPAIDSGGDPSLRAQLLTQIARAQGLQRRFEEARATLNQAQGLLRADLPAARTRWLLERGRLANSSGHKEESRPHFLSAWEVARNANLEGLAVDAAHMLGIVEEPEAALEWNHRALDLVEQSENPKIKGWLGPLYNNLGWTHHDRGEYQEALELFRKDLAYRTEIGRDREVRIAKWSTARTLRSLGRTEEALALQQELLEQWKAAGEEDGYVFEELGECLLALGRADEARPHFARAHELLSADPWTVENEPQRLQRLADLGGLEAR